VGRGSAAHERAERAHERAAVLHEGVSEFWDRHGRPERAGHERYLARVNREGAELERLRRERRDARSPERARELGGDRQLGLGRNPLDPTD
jgi:hypothetical protein